MYGTESLVFAPFQHQPVRDRRPPNYYGQYMDPEQRRQQVAAQNVRMNESYRQEQAAKNAQRAFWDVAQRTPLQLKSWGTEGQGELEEGQISMYEPAEFKSQKPKKTQFQPGPQNPRWPGNPGNPGSMQQLDSILWR